MSPCVSTRVELYGEEESGKEAKSEDMSVLVSADAFDERTARLKAIIYSDDDRFENLVILHIIMVCLSLSSLSSVFPSCQSTSPAACLLRAACLLPAC